eukprot:jgi/Botrbrau1/20206/Bobra.31_1s0003.1
MDGDLKNIQAQAPSTAPQQAWATQQPAPNGMPIIPAPAAAHRQQPAAGGQQLRPVLQNGIPQQNIQAVRGPAQPVLQQYPPGLYTAATPAAAHAAPVKAGYFLQTPSILLPQPGAAPNVTSDPARMQQMMTHPVALLQQRAQQQQQQQQPQQQRGVSQGTQQAAPQIQVHQGVGLVQQGQAVPLQGGQLQQAGVLQQQHLLQQQQQQQHLQQMQAIQRQQQAQALSQQQQTQQQQQQQQRYVMPQAQQAGRPGTPAQGSMAATDRIPAGQTQPAVPNTLSSYGVPTAVQGQVMHHGPRPGPARPLQTQHGYVTSNAMGHTAVGQPVPGGVPAGQQYPHLAPPPPQAPQGPPQVQGSLWLKPMQAPARGHAAPQPSAAVAEKQMVDDKKSISAAKFKRLLVSTGGGGQVTPEVEAILDTLAGDFIANALTLGCSTARKRKSSSLCPADVSPCMQQMWHISVPGFSGDTVRVYKRPKPSVIHKERLLLVQRQATGDVEGQKGGDQNGSTPIQALGKSKGAKVIASQTPGAKSKSGPSEQVLEQGMDKS